MKLSKNDLRILMAIKKEGRPTPNYLLARRLNVNPAQTHKRLKILVRERVLHEIEGYPKFYTFNSKNAAQNFVILNVECPKCQAVHVIHQAQTTIQCFCTTKSGKPTRFYVYSNRIKDMKIFDKNHVIKHDEHPQIAGSLNPFTEAI